MRLRWGNLSGSHTLFLTPSDAIRIQVGHIDGCNRAGWRGWAGSHYLGRAPTWQAARTLVEKAIKG